MAGKQKHKSKRPGGPRGGSDKRGPASALWLYGRHAVAAAIRNENRPLRRVIATKMALEWLKAEKISEGILSKISVSSAPEIDQVLQKGAVHQGIAAQVDALPKACLLYTSPSPRDLSTSRMPSSA